MKYILNVIKEKKGGKYGYKTRVKSALKKSSKIRDGSRNKRKSGSSGMCLFNTYMGKTGGKMTAKEYLYSIREDDIKIKLRLKEVDKLKDLIKSVGAVKYIDGKVQNTTNIDAPFMKTLEKIDEETARIDKMIDKLIDKKRQATEVIHTLKNEIQSDVLYKKYIEYKSLGEIAKDMHYSYSYVCHVHGFALLEFGKNFKYVKNIEV